VRGERGVALVHAARGLQSRASSALAAALMIALGLTALSWYYAHTFARQTRARQAAQSTVARRAESEMPLPALGPIAVPQPALLAPTAHAAEVAAMPGPAPLPLAETSVGPGETKSGTSSANPADPGLKTPGDLARERRLAGAVFTREADSPAGPMGSHPPAGQTLPGGSREQDSTSGDTRAAGEPGPAGLGALLRPTLTTGAAAQLLPDTRFLLPRGAFIDCTLETAVDSTLPGMTTCVTAADTFGADGHVVLLERGTKLTGETRGQVQQGQARVFVLWTQARTPTGVSVPLDSPGTDELGRSGLPGQVERHFWERFGAAMLVSLVEGAVQAGVQASSRGGNTIVYAPSASADVLAEVMKDTLRIAPTVVKRNGDRIQVLVARDIDFRTVYELRVRATAR
jgi:type IV secretion system protein VirB10